MNRGSMWIHVVAAVAALGFAWVTATRVEEKQGGPYHEQDRDGIPDALSARDSKAIQRYPEKENSNRSGNENTNSTGLLGCPA